MLKPTGLDGGERYVVTEKILVIIEGETSLETGTLVNVGTRGSYVSTTAELRGGERVVLTVHVPYGPGVSFRVAGVVGWDHVTQPCGGRHHEGYDIDFLVDRDTVQNTLEILRHLGARKSLVKLPP